MAVVSNSNAIYTGNGAAFYVESGGDPSETPGPFYIETLAVFWVWLRTYLRR